MNPYFWNGLQHALAGLACAWGFALAKKLKATASPRLEPASEAASARADADPSPVRLSQAGFWLALLMGSSALFSAGAH